MQILTLSVAIYLLTYGVSHSDLTELKVSKLSALTSPEKRKTLAKPKRSAIEHKSIRIEVLYGKLDSGLRQAPKLNTPGLIRLPTNVEFITNVPLMSSGGVLAPGRYQVSLLREHGELWLRMLSGRRELCRWRLEVGEYDSPTQGWRWTLSSIIESNTLSVCLQLRWRSRILELSLLPAEEKQSLLGDWELTSYPLPAEIAQVLSVGTLRHKNRAEVLQLTLHPGQPPVLELRDEQLAKLQELCSRYERELATGTQQEAQRVRSKLKSVKAQLSSLLKKSIPTRVKGTRVGHSTMERASAILTHSSSDVAIEIFGPFGNWSFDLESAKQK